MIVWSLALEVFCYRVDSLLFQFNLFFKMLFMIVWGLALSAFCFRVVSLSLSKAMESKDSNLSVSTSST